MFGNKKHNWLWALGQINQGRVVKREGWIAGKIYRPTDTKFIRIFGRHPESNWQPYAEDFSATDWILVSGAP